MRLLLAALLVAALLWWLLNEEGGGHRARDEEGARRETATSRTERIPGEGATPYAATDAPNPASGGAEDPPIPREPLRGRVQVLGRDDMPIEGVSFRSDPPGLAFARRTDSHGWTEWEGLVPNVAEHRIVDSLRKKEHRVQVPVTTIRFPDLVPLEVEFIDAYAGVVLQDGSVSLPAGIGATVHGRSPRVLLIAPIEAGEPCEFPLELHPPEGTAGTFGFREPVRSQVSRRAHAAHLRVPLWPECDLTIEFRLMDGAPASGVAVDAVLMGQEALHVRAEPSDSAGRTQVHGVPFIRGGAVTIRARGQTRTARLRRRAQLTSMVVGPVRRGSRGGIESGAVSTSVPMLPDAVEKTASFEVELRWLDRVPAGGVPVLLAFRVQGDEHARRSRTDAETGVARFEGLPAGPARVVALDPALAYEERLVPLREKSRASRTLGPAQGRSVTFVVGQGGGLPGARLHASSWYGELAPPLVRGVQELAAVTGPGGEFAWPGFPVSSIRVEASRGPWSGSTQVPAGIRDERRGVPLSRRRR